MPLAVTPQQQHELNEYGFTILPRFLDGKELDDINAGLANIPPGRGRHGLEVRFFLRLRRRLRSHERRVCRRPRATWCASS